MPRPNASRPLEGIRVLDLTRALSGPFAAMILGDLGASVVKVEPAEGGDMTRSWGPFAAGQSAYFLSANRSKHSLALDFRHADSLAVLRRMAKASDVLLENFRPGVANAMGMGYDVLAVDNPALVYASISGYGSTGPARDLPGFDQIAQGYAGLMSLTGTDEPTRVGAAMADMTAGMWAALGVVAALRTSEATGRGERLETSLVASLVGMLGVQGQRFLCTGEVPERTGNTHPVIAPYGTFNASDGPMNIAPATERMWRALCAVVDLPGLADDPRFANNAQRVEHRSLVHGLIDEQIARRTRSDWLDKLIAAGIPAGNINRLDEVFSDAQVRHCEMVRTVQHPVLGAIPQLALPIHFDSIDVQAPLSAPPMLGEDSISVLVGYGFDEEEIKTLIEHRVIVQHPSTFQSDTNQGDIPCFDSSQPRPLP